MSPTPPLPTRLHTLSPGRVRLIALALFAGISAILFANQDAGFTRDESFYFAYSEAYQEWFVDVENAKTPDDRTQAFSREPTMRIWSGNFEHPPLAKDVFGFSWRIFAMKDRRATSFRTEPPAPNARAARPGRGPPTKPSTSGAPAPAKTLIDAASADAASPDVASADAAKAAPAPYQPQRLRFDVQAGRATGFPEGSRVHLLAPLAQGQAVTAPERILATGTVTKRHRDRVEVSIDLAPTSDPTASAPTASDPTPEPTVSDAALTPDRLIELAELCTRPLPTNPAEIPITPCMGREVRSLDIMSESEAFRFPGILTGGLAVMLCFLLGELLFGWLVALLGSLLFIFVPEHFFHGFMACFDMPIVAAQLLTIYAFWRSLTDRRWALVAGVAWGVALLTKHNAFFVPFSLIVFWLWAGKDELYLRWAGFRDGLFRLQLPRFPLAFLIMPVVGLTMLFALWPRLWYDPLQSLRDWFGFHIHHEHYMQYWFGEPLQVPPFPFTYPIEKTLLTYPEVLLVLLPVGAFFLVPPATIKASMLATVARLKRLSPSRAATPPPPRRPMSPTSKVAVFTLVNGLVPLLVIALPSTPIFGGIKHWMTGTPFLALVAAYGLFRLTAAVRLPTWAAAVTAALLVAHPAKASIDNAWLGTNHYNALFAGGLQGGADKRLMRIFWGHEARYVCDWLNANAPLNARVYWQDATWGTYEMYQREGWLRNDIRYLGDYVGADIALNEPLQALWEPDQRARRHLEVAGPLFVLARHGVPYLNVYVRPRLELTAP